MGSGVGGPAELVSYEYEPWSPRSLSRTSGEPWPPAELVSYEYEPWPPAELVSYEYEPWSPAELVSYEYEPWPPEALYEYEPWSPEASSSYVSSDWSRLLASVTHVCARRCSAKLPEFVPVRATPRRTAHARLRVASEQHDVGVPSRAPPGVVDFAEHVRSGRPKDVGVAGRAGRRQRPVRGLVERVDQQRVVGSRAEGVVADLPVFPRVQDVPAVSFEKRVVGEPPFHGEHGRVRDERLQRPLGVHVDVEVEAALPRDDRQPEQIRAHHDARRGLVRLEDPRPRVGPRHVFPRGGVVEKYALEAGAGRFESSSEVRVDVGRRPRRLEDAPRDARRLRRERPFRPVRGAGRPAGAARARDVDAAADERGGRGERDAQRPAPAPPRVRVPLSGHPGAAALQAGRGSAADAAWRSRLVRRGRLHKIQL